MKTINEFIEALPKVELHLHLEGSFEPELMFEIAKRNQITLPFDSIESLKAAYQFENLQQFLDIYYQGMNVLQTEQDYFDLTWAYLQRVSAQNVRHVEVFWDPQGHLERDITFETQINGIYKALQQGQDQLDISFKLIMSFLRHLPEQSAFETLTLAEPYLDKIYAVGLDSSELGHPPEKFARVYQKCRELGLKLTAHAGEEGPSEYIWQALDLLNVDRIDHGNRALEDEALVQRLAEQKYTMTVCPLSNLKLKVVNQLDNHPIPQMLEQNLAATVNSDDPAYFGGYMNENLIALQQSVDLTSQQLYQLSLNAIDGSWADDSRKQQLRQELDKVLAAYE